MKSAFNLESITPERLHHFRTITDPLADKVITSIIESGQEEKINQVLMTLVRNDSFHPGMFSALGTEISDLLSNYIERSSKLPSWADPQLIANGERLFERNGPEVFMLLNVSSLPLCYTCGNGAQVLYKTGRLLTHNGNTDPLARRLMETAQMVVHALSTGGLSATGKGIITIQKVRLIHASIRYYLKHKQQGTWDTAQLGEPINQEDLTGTLMSFGPVILAGLIRLGIKLNDDDTTAWMHCWNIVGFLLGIDESLLPDTYQQGFQLATKILKDQARPSDEGKALTDSCDKFIRHIIPGNTFDKIPAYLMGYFLQDFSEASGKDLASFIGISTDANMKDKLVLDLAHLFSSGIDKVESREHLLGKVISKFNKLLLQGIIYHYNDGKQVQFFIPPSLQENWGIVETWQDHKATPELLGNRLSWQKKTTSITKPD